MKLEDNKFSDLLPWLVVPYNNITSLKKNNSLPHSLIISGLSGSGKLNLSLVLSSYLLYNNSFQPSNFTKEKVLKFLNIKDNNFDHHPDLYWIYPKEKKIISIDQIRNCIESVSLSSHQGGNKVVIIDTADYLTSASANSLLKILEEPPDDTYIILLSLNASSLLPTIRSRCQVFPICLPSIASSTDWLSSIFLEVEDNSLQNLLYLCDRSPLKTLMMCNTGLEARFNALSENLSKIYKSELSLQDFIGEILKENYTEFLSWLAIALRLDIKNSYLIQENNESMALSIFKPLFQNLTISKKFSQLDLIEDLIGSLDTGLNKEVALRHMLLQFSR
ncbi:MAG: hypothetical protein CMQ51_03375 [Gammaproteobacteria bacterium]|nr:hypothetical protein [Gammaproteobacteria bacterium]|tara:strand:+ start:2442 stop:3443 length:1002 start_codon:yes stop_codon:yes gene_type:complete